MRGQVPNHDSKQSAFVIMARMGQESGGSTVAQWPELASGSVIEPDLM